MKYISRFPSDVFEEAGWLCFGSEAALLLCPLKESLSLLSVMFSSIFVISQENGSNGFSHQSFTPSDIMRISESLNFGRPQSSPQFFILPFLSTLSGTKITPGARAIRKS